MYPLGEHKRPRERESARGLVRDTILRGHEKQFFFSLFKIPSQCLLVFLVQVNLREGKSSGSEKVKLWDVDFVVSREQELNKGFTAYDGNFDINVRRNALE
jgi:hypothetical protein